MANTVFGIIFIVVALVCFYFVYFLKADVYFGGKKTKTAFGRVIGEREEKQKKQYIVSFETEDGEVKEASTTWYEENDLVSAGDDVNLKYVDFTICKKPVLAVRIVKDGLLSGIL
ncbi:MAG: hypothetical protein LUG93_09185 [Lachnospiraceae bacterium]|nr:hypothetical protein [Lachnospiraceae bacterium]